MKYYLCGEMTSPPDFKPYFKKYEDELRYWGINDIFNPASVEWPEYIKGEARMRHYLKNLTDCDVLVLLPNYENSQAAKELDIYVAERLGIRIVLIHDLLREAEIAS